MRFFARYFEIFPLLVEEPTLCYVEVMLDIKILLRFFDIGFVKKHLLTLLLLALIPFGEILLLFFLEEFVGRYFILASTATTGFLGFFLTYGVVQRHIHKIKNRIFEGIYPVKGFIRLAGSLMGSLFLIIPGFATDVVGLFFFLPLFRDALGALVVRGLEIETKDLYEYLKLYDF